MTQIQMEVRRSQSLGELRRYFDRVQELRLAHAGDFDIQLRVAEVQDEIIQRAKTLRGQSAAIYLAENPGDDSLTDAPKTNAEEKSLDAAEIPSELREIDKRSWKRAIFLALFSTFIICAAFFYLIQAARKKFYLPQREGAASTAPANPKPIAKNEPAPGPVISLNPTLRLYTDLIPGTVSIDNGAPADLKDGELVLDNLQPGTHSVSVVGPNGNASFSFEVKDKNAPQIVGTPSASNAMAVLVSEQDGKGRIVTNGDSVLTIDGKPTGEVGADGLPLDDLGKTDHELQLAQNKDRQRFVWTYTQAPVLTAYVKSDPNAGTVVVMAGQDGVSVSINGKTYRRVTAQGQLRIPLKVGEYTVTAHKYGFVDPPPQTVEVKKAEEIPLQFSLEPIPQVAELQIRGAIPATQVVIDNQLAALVGADGSATVPNITAGGHTVELKHDQAVPKKLDRTFQAGSTVVLTGDDVQLERIASNQNAAPTTPPTEAEPAQPAPVDEVQPASSERVQKGGGFVPYHTTRMPGTYSFQAQGHIGGFLKHSKLQWYVAYEDSGNYVLFTLDGKHAIVRRIQDGKSTEVSRIPFSAGSSEWVQVDMVVKPDSVSTHIKSADGMWNNLGTVDSFGRDFTKGKVGFYVPGSDEIAVSNFRFSGH
ncbi:MAG: hypothetical protein JO033_17875 [Acidobacteriaceae bacterium]|nr:hypothetical protein [Acidobacteriaceae bacterium]